MQVSAFDIAKINTPTEIHLYARRLGELDRDDLKRAQ